MKSFMGMANGNAMANGKWKTANGETRQAARRIHSIYHLPFTICHLPLKEEPPARRTTGVTTAQNRDRLGLLPFGPDPVRGRPLHRPRPSSATAAERVYGNEKRKTRNE